MTRFLVGLLLLLFCGCNSEKEKLTSRVITVNSLAYCDTVTITDEVGSWALGLQTCKANNDSLYPLIVYLHGGVSTTITNKGHDAHKMFHFISDSLPLFIASPSGNRDAVWWSKIGVERIFASVDYMKAHYPIDPNKIFLAGVSDGATGVFAIAAQDNHPFAGFIGAAGFPVLFKNQLQTYMDNYKKAPIKMYVSGQDRLYPTDTVINFYKGLQDAGVPLQYTLYPEEEHGFDYKELERDTIIELIQKWTL